MEPQDRELPQIDRFCRQFLQLDPSPDYPEPALLRQAYVQQQLFNRLFGSKHAGRNQLPPRYRLRILKQLVSRIEGSVTDWEEHGVSDDLTESLGELLAQPLPADHVSTQTRSYVTYRLSLLERWSPLPSSSSPSPVREITLLESPSLISASGTTGLRTWEAALHLGQYLCVNLSLVAGRHVLELGAGTGFLSVLCARHLGAAHVLATDGSPEVVAALPENCLLNGLQCPQGDVEEFVEKSVDTPPARNITAARLVWGRSAGLKEASRKTGPWHNTDIVLGADITYDCELVSELLDTLGEVGQRLPGGVEMLIAATQRNEATFRVFLEGSRARGFRVEDVEFDMIPRKQQTGPFYDDSVQIRICQVIVPGTYVPAV